jgi:hypothetical protein
MGRPISRISPHRITGPVDREASSTAAAARGASSPRTRPSTRVEIENASHTASQPATEATPVQARGFHRSHEPSSRPPASTTGRCREMTSPRT